MDRKRIAIVYSGSRNWGGIDTYLKNLFKYYDRTRMELTLLSLGDWKVTCDIEKNGGKVEVFSGKRVNLVTIFKIVRFLRKNNFNLIVSGGLVADSYSRAVSLLSGIPYLAIAHSEFKYDYPNFLKRYTYSFLLFISRWKTKKYIAISNYMKEVLIKSGINSKKISVVYNGVEERDVAEDNSNGNHIIIGSIGRLELVKNYTELIKAMKLVKNQNIFLKIIGEGSEREKLEGTIKELGLEGRVMLPGKADDPGKVYKDLNIYIQTSLSEGFGLTVVEAMLAGLPVIVAPSGSLPEIVTDNETGIVAKGTDAKSIAEAIESLVSDKKLMKKVSIKGQESAVKRFGVKEWTDNLADAFFEVAK